MANNSSSRSQKLQEAQYLKEKGNECFKKRQYDKAVELYSQALNCDPNEPVIYANRAQAYLKLKRPESAKVDCDAALSLDATFVKALYRRGVAEVGLGLLEGARKDFEQVLRLDPANGDAAKEIENLDRTDTTVRPSVVEFRAVDKPAILRSRQNLRRIPVEVIHDDHSTPADFTASVTQDMQHSTINGEQRTSRNIEVDNASSEQRKNIPRVPPMPSTLYQFLIDYRVLKDHPDVFAEYFMQIDPTSYQLLFADLMDGDVLTDLVDGLERKITDSQIVNVRLLDKLLALTKIPYFDTAVLFWSDKERNALRTVLRTIKEREKNCDLKVMSSVYDAFGIAL